MDTIEKLKVLSDDSRYDLACACGTKDEERRTRGQDGRWLYPVALPQGGYSVLLKTLLSNACINDCKYCPLRAKTDIRRCTLQPEEVARVFLEYLRQRRVSGLFLSSAVMRSPDYTMERINAADREALLRVPGIGPETVRMIIKTRAERKVTDLRMVGLRGKRREKAGEYVVLE